MITHILVPCPLPIDNGQNTIRKETDKGPKKLNVYYVQYKYNPTPRT
jgi:hypothetical protein